MQTIPAVRPRADPFVPRVSVVLAALTIVALALAALVLLGRRVAGDLGRPLPPLDLAATGIIAATIAAGIRLLARCAHRGPFDKRAAAVLRWVPGVAIVGLAGAVSLPGSSPLGLTALWLAIAVEELAIWRRIRRPQPRDAGPRESARQPAEPVLQEGRTIGPTELHATPPASDLFSAGDVVQQLVRSRSAAGADRLQGWLRTDFEPSERNATLHVAFCPPFDETPKLTVRQVSGPASRIKPMQLMPYGVRLELKRTAAGHEVATVVIEFSAEAPLAHPPAPPGDATP